MPFYHENLVRESNAISSAYPWLIALEIIKKDDNEDFGGYDKIIADSSDFNWIDENDNPIVFKKFPFNISGLNIQSDGKIPSVTLQLFNTATIAKFMEEKDCLLGYNVILYFINVKAISIKNPDDTITYLYNTNNYPIKFPLLVKDGTIGKYISLQLGGPTYLTLPIPSQLFYRDFCNYEYRSEFCYMKHVSDDDLDDEDVTCDKSYEGCTALLDKYITHIPEIERPMGGLKYGGFPLLNKGTLRLG